MSFPICTGPSWRLLKGRLVARDVVARKNSTPNLNAVSVGLLRVIARRLL